LWGAFQLVGAVVVIEIAARARRARSAWKPVMHAVATLA